MYNKSSLNTPLLSSGSIPSAAVEASAAASTSRHSGVQAMPAFARTVSPQLQSRIEQARTGAQGAEFSHVIDIPDIPRTPQPAHIDKAMGELAFLNKKKMWADRTGDQQAIARLSRDICQQTFLLEGMVTALEKEKNPDAVITYDRIAQSLRENSPAVAQGSASYQRLFSDHKLFAGGTLEDKLHQATATFKAYEELLQDKNLDEQEKPYIQLSYGVFKDSVRQLVQEQEHKAALAGMYAGTPGHEQAQADLNKARAVETLVLKDETVQGLRDEKTLKNLGRAVLWSATSGGVASGGHFGVIKSMADDAVTGQPGYSHANWMQSVVQRTLVGGIATGVAFWAVGETVGPVVAYASEKLGGRPVVPVDPKIVYPDAPQVISENGIPRKLSPEEHAKAQQAVEQRRKEFKQAQPAFKLGSLVGDLLGYVSFGGAHAIRGLLGGVAGIDAKTLGARSVASGMGSAVMNAGLTYGQFKQTTPDGIPTHRLGAPKGKQQIADGVKRLNLLESANRRNVLAKTAGVTEGLAFANMLDTAVVNIDGSTLPGRLAKAGATLGEVTAMLVPFFGNATADGEAKEAQAQRAISSGPFPGTETALHGIMHPDSAHIPHTFQEPGSLGRTAENVFQVARHGAQLVPQLIVDSMDALATGTQNAVSTAYEAGASALRASASTLQQSGRRNAGDRAPLLA